MAPLLLRVVRPQRAHRIVLDEDALAAYADPLAASNRARGFNRNLHCTKRSRSAPPSTSVQATDLLQFDAAGGDDGDWRPPSAEPEPWDERRKELFTDFVAGLPRFSDELQGLAKAAEQTLSARVATVLCDSKCTCGSALHAHPKRFVDTLYATEDVLVSVKLPIYECASSSCHREVTARPGQVACIPGTATKHYDLTLASSETTPIWFDCSLLQLLHLLQYFDGAKLSVQKCAAVLLEHYDRNGFNPSTDCILPPLISKDVFRQRLGVALLEFDYLCCCLEDVSNLDVANWPGTGPLPQCGGCWQAGPGRPLHEVHVDFCFKLNHLRREGALFSKAVVNLVCVVPFLQPADCNNLPLNNPFTHSCTHRD